MSKDKNKVSIFFMVLMLVMAASAAFGYTAPTSGDFAVEVSELTVGNIIEGPIGYAVGVGLLAFGAFMIGAKGQIMAGLAALVGGGVFVAAPTIVESMGILY